MKLKIALRIKPKLKLRPVVISSAILTLLMATLNYFLCSTKTTLATGGGTNSSVRSSNSVLVNFGGATCGSSKALISLQNSYFLIFCECFIFLLKISLLKPLCKIIALLIPFSSFIGLLCKL